MKEETIIDKTMVSQAIVLKIKESSQPDKIMAKHIEDFDNPEKLTYEGKKNGFVPDIIAYFKKEANVYEIELDQKVSVDKWQLFDAFAKKNNGKFYVVVPDSFREEIRKIIKSHGISAGLIYFRTE